ncbi:MAG: pilus motility taxis protein HmpF [Cyanobacteria bacterium P01_A01_bin.45]
MLYLAEVQKQKGGLLGGGSKAELKLLACQKNDQSWITLPEEAIAAEEASKLNDGALVLAELNPSRQVQRIQEAGRPLVNILQNFSRQLEKFKVKEEEIDQWKESLTFQAQEFNRREMEMETRLEELRQMEEEFQGFEEEKKTFDSSRQELEDLQAEIDRNRQELEGAWEHLKGEQRRLEERESELPEAGLDSEQAQELMNLIERLSKSVIPTETVRDQLNFAAEQVENQQAILNPCWEQLEESKTSIEEQLSQAQQMSEDFSEAQAKWEQAQVTLEKNKAQLEIHSVLLESKEKCVQILQEQLQKTEDVCEQINSVAATPGVNNNQGIDLKALDNMSQEELEAKVKELESKLKIDSSFVEEQEQELTYKQKEIDKLTSGLVEASGEEKAKIESDLTDEKDSYQMLTESLVGQRRSIEESASLLQLHQTVLLRKQGKATSNGQTGDTLIDPIVSQLEIQRHKLSEEIEQINSEKEQLFAQNESIQKEIDDQIQNQQTQQQELQGMEENLTSMRDSIAQSQGKISLYQELLQPIQDCLDTIREKLAKMGENLAQLQETGESQQDAITEIQQTVSNLVGQS